MPPLCPCTHPTTTPPSYLVDATFIFISVICCVLSSLAFAVPGLIFILTRHHDHVAGTCADVSANSSTIPKLSRHPAYVPSIFWKRLRVSLVPLTRLPSRPRHQPPAFPMNTFVTPPVNPWSLSLPSKSATCPRHRGAFSHTYMFAMVSVTTSPLEAARVSQSRHQALAIRPNFGCFQGCSYHIYLYFLPFASADKLVDSSGCFSDHFLAYRLRHTFTKRLRHRERLMLSN
ncbi:hypothetical protein ONZ45_g14501 [Pleurotus djamor]|nr:hypothetical protein ONZ45_g14501 [Pleurotus djamor]